eukprot:1597090-Rhodomonas_salina.3
MLWRPESMTIQLGLQVEWKILGALSLGSADVEEGKRQSTARGTGCGGDGSGGGGRNHSTARERKIGERSWGKESRKRPE